MKYYILISALLIASCTPPSPAKVEQGWEKRVSELQDKSNKLEDSIKQHTKLCDSLTQEIYNYTAKKEIYRKGKTPVYIVTLHFQEHKMELSWDRISFDFEVPVDEYFYNECRIGEQLGSGRRTMKLLHSGDITISNKRIDYR